MAVQFNCTLHFQLFFFPFYFPLNCFNLIYPSIVFFIRFSTEFISFQSFTFLFLMHIHYNCIDWHINIIMQSIANEMRGHTLYTVKGNCFYSFIYSNWFIILRWSSLCISAQYNLIAALVWFTCFRSPSAIAWYLFSKNKTTNPGHQLSYSSQEPTQHNLCK